MEPSLGPDGPARDLGGGLVVARRAEREAARSRSSARPSSDAEPARRVCAAPPATSSPARCGVCPCRSSDALAFAQRAAGEPHPWARAWAASARELSTDATLRKLDEWLARRSRAAPAAVRGRERRGPDGTRALAVVAVDALADLAPLPTRARTGQWLTVSARLRVPASGGRGARARSERRAAARAGLVRRRDAARAIRARSARRVHGAGARDDRDRPATRRRGERLRRRRAARARERRARAG